MRVTALDRKARCCHYLGLSEALVVTCALPTGHDGAHRSAFVSALDRKEPRQALDRLGDPPAVGA